jgi:hypothetical protein
MITAMMGKPHHASYRIVWRHSTATGIRVVYSPSLEGYFVEMDDMSDWIIVSLLVLDIDTATRIANAYAADGQG